MSRAPTIILADDEPRIAAMLGGALREAGYRVTIAADGREALRRAIHRRPDLLVLNIDLEARPGSTVQERKDELDSLRGVPVIYLTGDTAIAARLRAEASGDALLHKPLGALQLRGTVERVLGGAARARGGRPTSAGSSGPA